MVAQVSTETFTRPSQVPGADPSDSDDILLALETARALEAQGETREAARWLRRAVEQAENDGNDRRVLALARAAADLTSTISTAPSPSAISSLPPSTAPQRGTVRPPPPKPMVAAPRTPPAPAPPQPTSNSQPVLARVSVRPASPPRVSSAPHSMAGAARPASSAPSRSLVAPRSIAQPPTATSRDKTPSERTQRVATMRVAIPASARDASVFVVRRLAAGQPPPAGTTEATLVLSGETTSEP